MSVNWKKTLFVVCDIVIAAYLLLAVTAFNKPDAKATTCTEVKIDVEQNVVEGFMTAGEIKRILSLDKCYPLSKPMADINARTIEECLKKSPFVENAECYKTHNGHVCIYVKQRIPVARVMADNGENYYVDQKGETMPVPTGSTAYVPIITGNVSKDFAKKELYAFGLFLRDNSLWNAQIEQINVTAQKELELIPRVGENVIFLGKPENYEEKLDRLKTFYEKGLNKVGWNKYSRISLEFNNQIICTKR